MKSRIFSSNERSYIALICFTVLIVTQAQSAVEVPIKGFLAKCRYVFTMADVSSASESQLYQRGPDNKYKAISSPKNLWGEDTSLVFDSFTDSPWLYTHEQIKLYEMEMRDHRTGEVIDKAAGYIAPRIKSNRGNDSFEMQYVDSFNFKGKEYRIGYYHQVVEGFFASKKFSYLGIYEKNKQYPAYFVKIDSSAKKPNFKIHPVKDGIDILIPNSESTFYVLSINSKASRRLEEKSYQREYISKTAKMTQPHFYSNTKTDWNVYFYGFRSGAGYKIEKSPEASNGIASYKNADGETILVSDIIWSSYGTLASPDTVILFNRDRGAIEHTIRLDTTRSFAGRNFVEIGTGIFALEEKLASYYTDLRLLEENGERYLIARQKPQTESTVAGIGSDISYDPGSSFIVHKISTGEQIVSFETKGQRIFVNEIGKEVEAPRVFKSIAEKKQPEFFTETSIIENERVR